MSLSRGAAICALDNREGKTKILTSSKHLVVLWVSGFSFGLDAGGKYLEERWPRREFCGEGCSRGRPRTALHGPSNV